MSETTRYAVRYYKDPKKFGGRGGVWVREFERREDAEKFASENCLYARPCVVVAVCA